MALNQWIYKNESDIFNNKPLVTMKRAYWLNNFIMINTEERLQKPRNELWGVPIKLSGNILKQLINICKECIQSKSEQLIQRYCLINVLNKKDLNEILGQMRIINNIVDIDNSYIYIVKW